METIIRRLFPRTYYRILGRTFKDGWDACEQTIVRQHRGQYTIDRVELYEDEIGIYEIGVVGEQTHGIR